MFKGMIAELLQGSGFINGANNGKEHQRLFFHSNRMAPSSSFTDLAVGTQVEYETEPSEKGGLRAVNVRISDTTTSARQSMPAPVTASRGVEYKFLNPYNFIRFLPAPARTELTAEQQLLSRCAPPPHDRYVGLTGEIACTLKTVTPLFISDPKVVAENEQGHKSYRFFQANGQYAIPATALRGAVRSVFEAATNSCLMIFEGQQLSKHFAADSAPTLVPARVEKIGDEYRLRLLTGTARLGTDYAPERGETLPAAWLYRYWPVEPSKTLLNDDPQGNEQTVERILDFQERADAGSIDLQGLAHGDRCFGLLERTRHPHPRIVFWDVWKLSRDQQSLEEQKKGQQRIVEGWLCLTNQNIERKHSERFFFVDQTRRQLPTTILLPEKVIKAYEALIKDYQERHDKERKEMREQKDLKTGVYNDGTLQLSRFIHNDEERKLRDGALVYAMLRGSFANPTVEFIAPVSVPRVSYEKSLADLMPPNLHACVKYEGLCPACRLFGWVHQNPPKELERVAYAGRVRFSHAKLEGEPRLLGEETLAILSSPKPTTTKFYLLDGQRPSANVDYDSPNAQLRGRKFYRHHGTANPQEYRRATDEEHDGRDNQNRTVVDALDKGNEFTFTVHFENLAPVELGALLWALELDGQGVQRLGFAKPLGFGSVEIQVTSLQVLDPAARYSSLAASKVDATAQRSQCVEQFKTALRGFYHKASFEALENITDLRRLLQPPPANLLVHYPRTTAEPEPEGKQYEWFMNSKGQHELSLPENDTDGLSLVGSQTRRR